MRKIYQFLLVIFFVSLLNGAGAQDKFVMYGNPFGQVGGEALTSKGFTGRGVKVGVVDVGFEKLHKALAFKHIIDSGRLYYARNYLYRALNTTDSILKPFMAEVPGSEIPMADFEHAEDCLLCDTLSLFNMNNTHGTHVMYMIAGKQRFTGISALACDADFYLAKTEFGKRDHFVEEVFLDRALSDLYSQGVRLVNLSLGYRDNFYLEGRNYNLEEMNGKTAYSTRACNKWASNGMILVVAAGNSGSKPWKRISAPGEADNVITVGSTWREASVLKAGFSSIGDYDYGYVKPDVVCYSTTGTSLSAPVITGLVAAMLQKRPGLTPGEVKEILQKSSTLYPFPNDYVGYGIPDGMKIMALLDNDTSNLTRAKNIEATGDTIILKASAEDYVDCFDKRDAIHVVDQYNLREKNEEITVVRNNGVARTTVVIDLKEVYEVVWPARKEF
jgi:subtilisin family serine protease